MSFKFEKLLIWQKSFKLGEEVNTVANTFPAFEIYNLTSQMRRAADSVGLNIAEGSTGNSDKEQVRFLSYANRSVIEVVACLLKAKSRGYINLNESERFYFLSVEVYKMISSFKRAVADRTSVV